MRRTYHHGDLRNALLAAALALVRRHGPGAVTLRDVAKRAGVSEAAPYHHFESKSHLLLEVAAQGFAALGERLISAAATGATAHDRLVAMGAAYVQFALDEPGYFRLLFGAHVVELVAHPAAAPTKQAGRAAAELLRQGVVELVAETGCRLPARDLERVLWSQIHGLAWLVLEQELRPEPSAEESVALARCAIELVLAGASMHVTPATRSRARTARKSAAATRRWSRMQ